MSAQHERRTVVTLPSPIAQHSIWKEARDRLRDALRVSLLRRYSMDALKGLGELGFVERGGGAIEDTAVSHVPPHLTSSAVQNSLRAFELEASKAHTAQVQAAAGVGGLNSSTSAAQATGLVASEDLLELYREDTVPLAAVLLHGAELDAREDGRHQLRSEPSFSTRLDVRPSLETASNMWQLDPDQFRVFAATSVRFLLKVAGDGPRADLLPFGQIKDTDKLPRLSVVTGEPGVGKSRVRRRCPCCPRQRCV